MKRIIVLSVLILFTSTVFAQVKVWPPESLAIRATANLGRLANAKTSYQTVYMNIVECDKYIVGMKLGTLVPVPTISGMVYVKPASSAFAKETYKGYIDAKSKLASKADEYTRAVQEEAGWPQKERAVQWLLMPNR